MTFLARKKLSLSLFPKLLQVKYLPSYSFVAEQCLLDSSCVVKVRLWWSPNLFNAICENLACAKP